MTARELQRQFETFASYNDVLSNIRINSNVVNIFLNEGQDAFIIERLDAYKKDIKSNQRVLDSIRPLIVKNKVLDLNNTKSTSDYKVFNLPSDYLYLIGDKSETEYCNKTYKNQNRLYSSEEINDILKDSHAQSHYESPVSEIENNYLYVHLNKYFDFTIKSVNIDYIKKYEKIDVLNDKTSVLDDSFHRDVVQLAITIFLESVQSNRFRTNVEKNMIVTSQIK